MKFYKCVECERINLALIDKDSVINCCGKELELLSSTVIEETDLEHQIKIRQVGNFFTISLDHPMKAIHNISFIAIKTNKEYQIKHLLLTDKPEITFLVDMEALVESVYVYCSLKGLIKLDINNN